MIRFLSLFVLFLPIGSFSQSALLQSGPMVGYCEMREVMLWAQTKSEAKVKFSYVEKGKTEPIYYTEEWATTASDAFTAHLICNQVEPGKIYEYTLHINGEAVKLPYPTVFKTQTLWQFRTDPPAFKFATGSCAFVGEIQYDRPGKPYGGDYEIFNKINAATPEFMLWLGDNTYLREVDWFSTTGIQKRYTHTRSIPELQPLLAGCANFAIWDDHDYGPNDSDRGFIHKEKTLDAFRDFWANPTYGLNGDHSGTTTQFTWNDCDFFLLDNRWFRAPDMRTTGERTMIGEQQFQWLIDALRTSRAPFKFVAIGGQVLSTVDKQETYTHFFPQERTRLLKAIEDEKIPGVIFLTGDRHQTELSMYKPADGFPIYDLTISPLTSTSYDPNKEVNDLRVEGTGVGVRNYAILEVSGARNERVLKMSVYDVEGKLSWTKDIPQDKESQK